MRQVFRVASRVLAALAGVAAAAAIFVAGYAFNSFQQIGASQKGFTAERVSASICGSSASSRPLPIRPIQDSEDLAKKLRAAELRISKLQKEIGHAQSSNGDCSFSPDVMRMLDGARSSTE